MFPYEGSEILSVCPYPEKRNHPILVNISPTLVIDTSIERSPQVLHHGHAYILYFFKKCSIFFHLYFELCEVLDHPISQYQSYSSNWYINGKVFTSTMEWKPKNLILLRKKHAYLSFSAIMFCKQFLAYSVPIDKSAFLYNP